MHLRTLLLALLCTAALGASAGPPLPEGGPRPAALRAAEPPAQPFLATDGITLDGLAGAPATPQPPRELHLGKQRDRSPDRVVARHCNRDRLGFSKTVRESRFSGPCRFGGTPPPPHHV